MAKSPPPPPAARGAKAPAARRGRPVALPTAIEAAELFLKSHRFHAPDSRASLNFRFTGRLNLIARRYRTRLNEVLRQIGQSQARWDALFWISVSEKGATQRELAERIGVEGPTLVTMLHKLEQEGLVERQKVETDGRAKTIRLSAAAEEVLAQIAALSGPFRDSLLADISDEDLRICESVFNRILERLDRG
jgi:MarR family transcriptional regulator for hemolysin